MSVYLQSALASIGTFVILTSILLGFSWIQSHNEEQNAPFPGFLILITIFIIETMLVLIAIASFAMYLYSDTMVAQLPTLLRVGIPILFSGLVLKFIQWALHQASSKKKANDFIGILGLGLLEGYSYLFANLTFWTGAFIIALFPITFFVRILFF